MKTETAPEKTEQELLTELGVHMSKKEYSKVRLMFLRYPKLINGLTPKCEVPLVMAINCWDPTLVKICMEHGADAWEYHQCSKDMKSKSPVLILSFVLGERNSKCRRFANHVMDYYLDGYYEMMRHMQRKKTFPKGAK